MRDVSLRSHIFLSFPLASLVSSTPADHTSVVLPLSAPFKTSFSIPQFRWFVKPPAWTRTDRSSTSLIRYFSHPSDRSFSDMLYCQYFKNNVLYNWCPILQDSNPPGSRHVTLCPVTCVNALHNGGNAVNASYVI